jgi:hypothetical protein
MDVGRIVVTYISRSNAAYMPRTRTCYLAERVVRTHSAANVAMLLVHEATHARFEQSGINQWSDLRPRFERRCVIEELSFAKRLSQGNYPGIDAWIDKRIRTSKALHAR